MTMNDEEPTPVAAQLGNLEASLHPARQKKSTPSQNELTQLTQPLSHRLQALLGRQKK